MGVGDWNRQLLDFQDFGGIGIWIDLVWFSGRNGLGLEVFPQIELDMEFECCACQPAAADVAQIWV